MPCIIDREPLLEQEQPGRKGASSRSAETLQLCRAGDRGQNAQGASVSERLRTRAEVRPDARRPAEPTQPVIPVRFMRPRTTPSSAMAMHENGTRISPLPLGDS